MWPTSRSAERGARLPVLDSLNLVVRDGEAVGICGESGAGKTTLAHAILRLLPRLRGEIAGKLRFRGEDLLGMPPRRLQEVRGPPEIAVQPDRRAGLTPPMIDAAMSSAPDFFSAALWLDDSH